MDDAAIRWHLSAVRVLVLDIIAEQREATSETIVAAWSTRHPALSPRHRAALPRMTSEILWRFNNLEWIERADGRLRLTELGVHARSVAHPDG